jgi:putative membrane protein|tara:strand:- start:33607 stop:34146 length:540 start_codon:yes stop_codon:yes gene_type:complete
MEINKNSAPSLKYKKWIILLSIAIPVLVAILFGIRIPNVEPLNFLPPIYASINGLTAVLLVFAFISIKQRNIILHERLMKCAIALSVVFLGMYVAYHMTSDPTPYGGKGIIKGIYFFILISHILLSIGIIPMVLITYVRAISKLFKDHKRIARITFPIWLYIAVTGVIVYLMISPYYVN